MNAINKYPNLKNCTEVNYLSINKHLTKMQCSDEKLYKKIIDSSEFNHHLNQIILRAIKFDLINKYFPNELVELDLAVKNLLINKVKGAKDAN